jgi:hypothetical protein
MAVHQMEFRLPGKSSHFDYWVWMKVYTTPFRIKESQKKPLGEYLLFLNSGDHLYNHHSILEENKKCI